MEPSSNTKNEPTSSPKASTSPPCHATPIVVPPPPPLSVERRSQLLSLAVEPPPQNLPTPPQPFHQRPIIMAPTPPHYQNVTPPPYCLPGVPVVPGIIQPQGYTYPTGHQRSWSSGLFDCSLDMRNCCATVFCPCVTFGQISEIINEGQTPCFEGCVVYAFVKLCCIPETGGTLTGVFGGWYRKKMREKYKLKGSLLHDCLVHVFCEPCALCQEFRELGRYGFEVPLGWKENIEMQQTATAVYQVEPPVVEQGMTR